MDPIPSPEPIIKTEPLENIQIDKSPPDLASSWIDRKIGEATDTINGLEWQIKYAEEHEEPYYTPEYRQRLNEVRDQRIVLDEEKERIQNGDQTTIERYSALERERLRRLEEEERRKQEFEDKVPATLFLGVTPELFDTNYKSTEEDKKNGYKQKYGLGRFKEDMRISFRKLKEEEGVSDSIFELMKSRVQFFRRKALNYEEVDIDNNPEDSVAWTQLEVFISDPDVIADYERTNRILGILSNIYNTIGRGPRIPKPSFKNEIVNEKLVDAFTKYLREHWVQSHRANKGNDFLQEFLDSMGTVLGKMPTSTLAETRELRHKLFERFSREEGYYSMGLHYLLGTFKSEEEKKALGKYVFSTSNPDPELLRYFTMLEDGTFAKTFW